MQIPTKSPRKRASFRHDDELSLGLDDDIINATVTVAATWEPLPTIDATDVTTANATTGSAVAIAAVADATAIAATASSGSDSSYDIRYNIARSYSSDDDSYSYSSGSSSSSSGYGLTNNNRQANRNTIDDANSMFSSPPEELTPHELAAQVAQRVASRFYKNLPPKLMQDYSSKDCVAPFDVKEIVLGKLLGSGEFSHVYEIKSFMLVKDGAKNDDGNSNNDNDNDDDDAMTKNSYTPEQIKTREHMKRREQYHTTKKIMLRRQTPPSKTSRRLRRARLRPIGIRPGQRGRILIRAPTSQHSQIARHILLRRAWVRERTQGILSNH